MENRHCVNTVMPVIFVCIKYSHSDPMRAADLGTQQMTELIETASQKTGF